MSSPTTTISSIVARQIYDSRGHPTIECDLTDSAGRVHRGVSPSGASTGILEALELRDGGSAHHGKGVLKAVANVNGVLAPALLGRDVRDQRGADELMTRVLDGSSSIEAGWCKSKLGANAILAVSMALCRAGAAAAGVPLYAYIAGLAGRPAGGVTLPVPFINVINGGEHSGAPIVFQEFMLAPIGAGSFAEAMQMSSETFHHLRALIKAKWGVGALGAGDEGGFAPDVSSPEEALDLLVAAIERAGYTGRIKIAMDVAASEFATEDAPPRYDLGKKLRARGAADTLGSRSGEEMVELYAALAAKYPLVSLEDPFDQMDAPRWVAVTARLAPAPLQVVADDSTVTNILRVRRAIDERWATCLLTKVNQIGTITESIDAVLMAQAAGWSAMVSHRSGETEDCFIADLAVGLDCGQIKSGAPCRAERTAKYNQLLRIEAALGARAKFAGADFAKKLW